MIDYRARPDVSNTELNDLFAASWPDFTSADFQRQLAHSLTWVCAYDGRRLVGFVNVAWDGGVHAFILDTTVHPDHRRQGIGQRLVEHAVTIARDHDIHWLHVDFEPHLREFYFGCGFRETDAGVMKLTGSGIRDSGTGD